MKAIFSPRTERTSIVQDGLLFEPIGESHYKATIHTSYGDIWVMYGLQGSDITHPYEVWYPGAKEPVTFQTANDIMNYILTR